MNASGQIQAARWLAASLILSLAIFTSQAAAEEGNGLYFFTSSGCPPCRQVEPILESLAQQGFPITKIDVNQFPAWADGYRITGTPTLVMVRENQELMRHAGFAPEATIRGWFSQFQLGPQAASAGVASRSNPLPRSNPSAGAAVAGDTMHIGTPNPRNRAEQVAMNATVRLRVEDAEGYSYATGTVIHCINGEWLVLTCGHVFRNSRGQGTITGEIGFGDGARRVVRGDLIAYESEVRDVGLVSLHANAEIEPVPLALSADRCREGDSIFTIGCDRGDDPTIRHSQIKGHIKCDGVPKYLIYGKPVIGRSGGGLFDAAGQLVGVCNAASVDIDEGIYASLENIEWQLNRANLASVVRNGSTKQSFAATPSFRGSPTGAAGGPGSSPVMVAFENGSRHDLGNRRPATQLVSQQVGGLDETEVTVLVRSASNPLQTDAFTLPNPSPELLDYLRRMRARAAALFAQDRGRGVLAGERGLVQRSRPTFQEGNGQGSSLDDLEVIILIQSRADLQRGEAFTLPHPSPELLEFLAQLRTQTSGSDPAAEIADMTYAMPEVPLPFPPSATYRSQSPY